MIKISYLQLDRGRTFADLLESKCLAQSQLQTIYRQGDESTIITLAHAVKNGQLPADLQLNRSDRSFIACKASQIEEVVKQVVLKAHARGFKTKDIQILAPMYRGVAGIDKLNVMLQNILNPLKPEQKQLEFGKQVFRIGDKVLHLVNSLKTMFSMGIWDRSLESQRPRKTKIIKSL